jgi:hypothetical protein
MRCTLLLTVADPGSGVSSQAIMARGYVRPNCLEELLLLLTAQCPLTLPQKDETVNRKTAEILRFLFGKPLNMSRELELRLHV